MRRLLSLGVALLCGALLSGCGDPAPSTTLAPDKPMGDASKLTAEQLAAAHQSSVPDARK